MKKIGIFSLLWSGIKLNFLHAAWNFERLQNVGFLYAIYNLLRRIYDKNKYGLIGAINRHISFFNTHIFFASAAVGVIAKLESDIKEDDEKKNAEIESTKMGIMGPLAAIGDSLFWSGLKPLALLLGAGIIFLTGFSMKSLTGGVIVSLAVYNIPRLIIKYYLLFKAYYNHGDLFTQIQKIKFQEIMKSVKLIGMCMLGGIMGGFFNVKQDFILQNKFIDTVLLVVIFLLITEALRRKTVINHVFFAVIAFSIILAYVRIL